MGSSELTPFQYGSNDPVSGVDLDGLAYIHFVVLLNPDGTVLGKKIAEDFRNRSEAELNRIHNTTEFYKKYSAGFGPQGKGVKYTYLRLTGEGSTRYENVSNNWEVRQNDIMSEITRHRLYAGEGAITTRGSKFSPKEGEKIAAIGFYDFGYKPINMIDALSRKHDMDEDVEEFQGWQHPQNIFADIRFVKGIKRYLESDKNKDYIDPFTGRKPSEEAISFAKNAVTFFSNEIKTKKIKLIMQTVAKEMSMDLHKYIERVINFTEKKDVELPAPNKTDK